MAAVSLTPSLVALTRAEPAPTPVTIPLGSTVAAAVLSLAQVIGRASMSVPWASRSVTYSATLPCNTNAAVAGVTATDAIGRGGPTLTDTTPLAGPLVAVIVALPRLIPVTVANASPELEELPAATAATPGALLIQITDGYSSGFPAASSTLAVTMIASPAGTEAALGETTTVPGPATTVTTAVSLWPSTVAEILAIPAPTPVTIPPREKPAATVATVGSLLDHLIRRGICTIAPVVSLISAPSCSVRPRATRADSGVTVTD
jgi:hypothetical protein